MAIITTNKNKTPLGIYIHVPFCRSKCEYCDFYSIPGKHEELYAAYTEAVCRHIRETGPLAPKHRVDTISVYASPAPARRAIRRYAASVTPAIGAMR